MATTPVAVITRTRNRPVFLARALRSVADQSWDDRLHVIVNDGGDLAEVQRAVAALPVESGSRVLVVDNQDSRGREAAVNVGMDAADSRYFAIHDDDDFWEPTFLERTVSHLEDTPGEVAVFVRCDVVHERLDGDVLVEDAREVLAADLHAISLVDTMVANVSPPIAQLVRRDAADRIGHWDGTLRVQADWEFTLRLLREGPVGFIDGECLAHWSHRPPVDGDAGNSVVSERQAHHDINLAIRDRYLRPSGLQGGDDGFGTALTSAEYFRRLDEHMASALGDVLTRTNQTATDNSAHIDAIHADMVRAISEQNHRLDEINRKLDQLLEARTLLSRFRSLRLGGGRNAPGR